MKVENNYNINKPEIINKSEFLKHENIASSLDSALETYATDPSMAYELNRYLRSSKTVAKKFAGENGVVLEINLPVGTKYIDVANSFALAGEYHRFARQEHEFLLPRSSKFKVVEPIDKDNLVRIEYMGEVFPKETLKSKF